MSYYHNISLQILMYMYILLIIQESLKDIHNIDNLVKTVWHLIRQIRYQLDG